jgi:hypothetical protein
MGEQMADVDLQAEIAILKAENDRLKGRSERGITLKVSEKGALSVYGLGRFPVTLYKEQWRRVRAMAVEIESYIQENDNKLKTKE